MLEEQLGQCGRRGINEGRGVRDKDSGNRAASEVGFSVIVMTLISGDVEGF